MFLKRYIEASRSDSDLLIRWWSLVLLPYDLIILLFRGLDTYQCQNTKIYYPDLMVSLSEDTVGLGL